MSVDIKVVKSLAKSLKIETARLEVCRRAAFDAIERGAQSERAKVLAYWRDEANIAKYVSTRLLDLMGAENHHVGAGCITPARWPDGPGTTALLKQCAESPQECERVAKILTDRIARIKEMQSEAKGVMSKNYDWSCWSALAPISAWILRTPKWTRAGLVRFMKKLGYHEYVGDAP